jgi:hypothetical protein
MKPSFVGWNNGDAERLRVPETSEPDRRALSDLARQATGLARDRYRLHETVRHRILVDLGTGPVTLNQKLTAWWDLDLGSFRSEVKKALKTAIPVAERSEWERALVDWQRHHTALTESLMACEQQINDRVYRLFCLSPGDIRFLDDHASHAMIDAPPLRPALASRAHRRNLALGEGLQRARRGSPTRSARVSNALGEGLQRARRGSPTPPKPPTEGLPRIHRARRGRSVRDRPQRCG